MGCLMYGIFQYMGRHADHVYIKHLTVVTMMVVVVKVVIWDRGSGCRGGCDRGHCRSTGGSGGLGSGCRSAMTTAYYCIKH